MSAVPLPQYHVEDRFVAEQLPADEKGRRLWGLRDVVTGELVQAGGETDRWAGPEIARSHRLQYWYIAQRAEQSRG
ncbi:MULTISPECIES: hypothetical protein [unclassified Kitasatospora]|uniref:hypothetical protein n=1 Tax=unclassified Kitasatospora TaxID=2633591 RepID=UPI00070E322A|nr:MULTISPECIES: hypothetical protein [unclassified Kitasatospora]KQV17344.1 hypothetical protein ASC99_25870 [Kitasatospora sp. Root107]KRB65566.1 hypothetical protein ASE03_32215 [Kitasatospora sp. Root187]